MKTGTKVILIAFLFLLLLIIVSAGALLYYYTHPSATKDLVENSLSRAIGASAAIRQLSYGRDPWHISAKGITVEPGKGAQGVFLEVSDLDAVFSLQGSFGRKSLVVNRLEINGLGFRVVEDTSVSGMTGGSKTPSFVSRVLKRAFAFLVFRDLRLEDATLTHGAATVQLDDQILRFDDLEGRLNTDHRVEISTEVRFERASSKMHLFAPRLQVKTDGAISLSDNRIGVSVNFDEVLFQSPFLDVNHLKGGARLRYRPDRGTVTFEDLNATLEEADIRTDGQKDPVRLDVKVTADGALSLKDRELTVSPLHLTLGDRLQLEGKLNGEMGARKSIELEVAHCRLMPQELIPLFPASVRDRAEPIELDGVVHVAGRIKGTEKPNRWVWDTELNARLNRNQVSFTRGNLRLSGTLFGSIEVRGEIPAMEISTDLKAEDAIYRGTGIAMEPFKAAVSFSGRYPLLDLKALSARIPRVTGRFKGRTVQVEDIHLEAGKGRVNAATRTGSLPEIRFDSSLLKNLFASLEVEKGALKTVHVQGRDTGLAKGAVGLGLLDSGWHLDVKDALRVRVRCDEEKRLAVTSEWTFQEAGFQSPDGTIMGEGISFRATLNGETDPSGHLVSADVTVDAGEGEVLYDRFYANLKAHPLSFGFTGMVNMQERDLQLSRLSLGLKDLLTCDIKGRMVEKGPAWQLDLTADIPDLPVKPLFRFLVVEPYQMEKPILGTLQLEGAVAAGLSVTGTLSAWTTKGSFRWRQGKISSEERGVELTGIELALPFWLRNHDRENAGRALEGGLTIDSLRIPFIPEQALAVPLRAGPNRLSVANPTIVKIPGGEVRLGPVMIDRLPGAATISTDLAMNRVDLEPILASVWPRLVQGTISGTLNPVRMKGGRLTSSGKLTARVFDGEVILSDPGVSGLFLGSPVFHLNARWKDLNLAELTADTAFGRIDGVLKGYAKEVEIAQGEVQKFDLRVETVQQEGTPQRISVKAVENIAQIGGGQSPFVGMAGMVASIFKEFPYEKIGVHATLENDVFRINGTIQEGDTEYLVKRGFLSGVNVVNQNLDNRVGFKDMIKRIRRIKTSQDGPVIK